MIIFVDAVGVGNVVIPEPIVQGSVGVNTIYVVAPETAAASVTANFILPNGQIQDNLLMTPLNEITLGGEIYQAYSYVLGSEITNFPGELIMSFSFNSAASEILRTIRVTENVLESTAPILPDAPTADVYKTIVDAIAYITNKYNEIVAAGGNIDNKIAAHNADVTAHPAIQQKITDDIATHNTNGSSHQDIRALVGRAQETGNTAIQKAENAVTVAGEAQTVANEAKDASAAAVESANGAVGAAEAATNTANTALSKANQNANDIITANTNITKAQTTADSADTKADQALMKINSLPHNISYENYDAMKTGLNAASANDFTIGQSIYLVDDTPDTWVTQIMPTYVPFTGTKDDFIEALKNGLVQFGYANLNALGADTPDITNMVTTDTDQTIGGKKNFTQVPQFNGHDLTTTLNRFTEEVITGTLTYDSTENKYVYDGNLPSQLSNVSDSSKAAILIIEAPFSTYNDAGLLFLGEYPLYKMEAGSQVQVTMKDVAPFMSNTVNSNFTITLKVNRIVGNVFLLLDVVRPGVVCLSGNDVKSMIDSCPLPQNQLVFCMSDSSDGTISGRSFYRSYNGRLFNSTPASSLRPKVYKGLLNRGDWVKRTGTYKYNFVNYNDLSSYPTGSLGVYSTFSEGSYAPFLNAEKYPAANFNFPGKTVQSIEEEGFGENEFGRYRAFKVVLSNATYSFRIYKNRIMLAAVAGSYTDTLSNITYTLNEYYYYKSSLEAYDLKGKKLFISAELADSSAERANTVGLENRFIIDKDFYLTFIALENPSSYSHIEFTVIYDSDAIGVGTNGLDIGKMVNTHGIDLKSRLVSAGGGSSSKAIAPIELDLKTIGTDIDTLYFNTKMTDQETAEFFNYNLEESGAISIKKGSSEQAAFSWGYDTTVGTYFIVYGVGASFTAKGLWSENAGTITRGSIGSITFPGGWNTSYINEFTGAMNLAATFDDVSLTGAMVSVNRYFDVMIAGSEFSDDYTRIVMDSAQWGAIDTVVLKEKEISTWTASAAVYSQLGYPYVGEIYYNNGFVGTSDYIPDVTPVELDDIMSGDFAPFAETDSLGIKVYCAKQPTTTKKFNVVLHLTKLN